MKKPTPPPAPLKTARRTAPTPTPARASLFTDLYAALLRLESVDECERFMADLCTPAELLSLADRWRVARLLSEGMPYRLIHDATGVSTATVTRVARALTYGDGGYQVVLERTRAAATRAPRRKKEA